jgi:hypothetical protein
MAFVEAEAPRVECRPRRGRGRAGAVGSARERFTPAFAQQVAWLATRRSKTALCELTGIGWYTVGRIVERVVARGRAPAGRTRSSG